MGGMLGEKVVIPGSPALTIPELLDEAERSLDLGLGLAWAPSKVREEALLPKSSFFTRTGSLGSNRDRTIGREMPVGREDLSTE